jgi:hypothetical protein
MGERHATRTRELARDHGYDTKYAMHALRIGYQSIELLKTGRITLPMPEPQRGALREVRAGAVPLDAVLEHLARVDAELVATTEAAKRDAPDIDAVDGFVVRAYRSAWQ